MMDRLKILICFTLISYIASGQVQLEFNANIDFETSYVSENSHYWYNEIHSNSTGLSFDLPELNLLSKLILNDNWAIHGRFLTRRELGKRPGILQGLEDYEYIFPQVNIRWQSSKKPLKITIGKFLNGYGNFVENQLSYQRTFINRPLFYSYYVNTSDKVGSAPNLGETAIFLVNGSREWGTIPFYYGGYSTGIKFNYGLEGQTQGSIALVTGTPSKLNLRQNTFAPTLVANFSHPINYATSIGFSAMHGAFMNSVDSVNITRISRYSQSAIGVDLTYGSGFFELKSELNASYFRSPTATGSAEEFQVNEDLVSLFSLAPRLDIKYEFSRISGLFTALRLDGMFPLYSGQNWPFESNWEDNIVALDIAFGYKITSYLQLRINASQQRQFASNTIVRNGIRSLVIFFF